MTININVENAAAEAAQSCLRNSNSAGTEDKLALSTKIVTTLALALCACLTTGFVTILRAIRAMHADLVKTRKAGIQAQIPATSENGTEPLSPDIEPTSGHEAEDPATPDSSDEAEMFGAWWEVGKITFAWLGRSASSTATTMAGMIPGFAPDAEVGYALP